MMRSRTIFSSTLLFTFIHTDLAISNSTPQSLSLWIEANGQPYEARQLDMIPFAEEHNFNTVGESNGRNNIQALDSFLHTTPTDYLSSYQGAKPFYSKTELTIEDDKGK